MRVAIRACGNNAYNTNLSQNWLRHLYAVMSNRILATDYHSVLPSEKLLAEELAKTRRELEDFLVRNASTRSRMAGEGDPPRLTASAWFRREHRKVPQALWRDARVNSASNCSACHSRAGQGSYRGREIALPELRDKH